MSTESIPGLQQGIERRGLRDHVYERVLELLLRGDVEPGARLSIDTIARQLGVSPTPVREAFVHLERTGLVTREALKGYRVAAPLGKDQLTELLEARLMLEVTAARLAEKNREALIPALRDAQARHAEVGDRLIAHLDAGEALNIALTTEYFSRDRDFHSVIFEHSGNRYLKQMSDSMGAQLHRMRQSVRQGITDVHEAVNEHAAVLAAFERGESGSAVAAMQSHLSNVRDRSIAAEEEHGH
ncbi:GntR family transcriptional regulator [Humidisolicoccus flavus]|uniref:GntR family transcriptional regulator n=1 Tax=Humidisolicoccus flavus TaxID=3111414 RepID=UPI00324A454D